jgi:tetratricopeptide (TPR) repeat protein
MARVKNNLGVLLMRQGDLDGANRHLEGSLALCDELGLVQGKSHALLSLAELNLAREALDEAEGLIDEAAALSEKLGELMTLAAALQLRGRLAGLRKQPLAADHAYQAAIAQLSKLNASQRLLECHAEYAQELEHRGDKDRALAHWKLALGVQQPELVSRLAGEKELALAGRSSTA